MDTHIVQVSTRLKPDAEFQLRHGTFARILLPLRSYHADGNTLGLLLEFVIPLWLLLAPVINGLQEIILECRGIPTCVRLIVIREFDVCYLLAPRPHNDPCTFRLLCQWFEDRQACLLWLR